jgi:hypothetical protein
VKRDTDQGQSLATIDKERRIGAALAIGMRIASDQFAGSRFRWWHFDANAGAGFNEKIGVPGSPMVFWQAAHKHLALRPAPFFCDINTTAIGELRTALSGNGASVFMPMDNNAALIRFAGAITDAGENPKYATGTVVVDPNGYYYRNKQNIGAPTDALDWFLPRFPRVDIVLNLNTRVYRLQKSQGHAVLAPRDLLASLHKKYWLVGSTQHGGDSFLIAIGRNVPTGDFAAAGLHKSTSPIGQSILSAAEGGRQQKMDLFQ